MPLPVVDLAPLHTGAPQGGRSTVAEMIDAACRDTGCFVVEGHGIAPEIRAGVFDAAHRLFALPLEQKERLAIDRSSCRRGYVGAEHRAEAFDLSRDLDDSHPEVAAGTPLYGPNQWPGLDGFREQVGAYFAAAFETAQMVSRGMALALGLDPAYFTRRMTDSVTFLRLVHTPPTPASDCTGCVARTDEGLLTLLAQDGSDGLEVRGRDERWTEVAIEPDQLVVNVGDMMARWSNDRWVSTPYRVHGSADAHRYSVPLFVNPDFHCTVQPIVTAGADARHDPVTAGEHLVASFASARADR
jgi:isopenicillin N synthase-like dioxygenase